MSPECNISCEGNIAGKLIKYNYPAHEMSLPKCRPQWLSWMHPTRDQEVVGSTPQGRQHSFMEIDHEIFSTVILSIPLIQEGQLVSGKRMCTILVNRLRGLSLPSKSVVR